MLSRLSGVRLTCIAIAVSAGIGCASKSGPTPAPVATPSSAAASTPTWLSCPDPTDGPSIVVNAIDEAHRAFVANPATPLPPACVLATFARLPGRGTDSVNDRALALAAESRRRGPEQRDLLAADVLLLARARRYADASRTYDRLVALDSQPALDVSRVAIAAAHQRADTAALLRILAHTMSRPDAGSSMRAEYNVVRQTSQLWAALNEARGLVRQNPKYLMAYPSIVGNFGTLGLADSVNVSIRRALAQGAPRASVAPSVENLVSAMLRHATLYGSTYGWDAQVAAAARVDSALSAPSTKFLVADLTLHSAEQRVAEISTLVGAPGLLPPPNSASREQMQRNRASGCQRIAAVTTSLSTAEARMRDGGDRFPGDGPAQVRSGLSAAREKLASLQALCARSTE